MVGHVFNFFHDKQLISVHQSGFVPGDSTINQLLAYHELCLAIDQHKVVFLDISKAFDKVWHAGLLFKLKKNGITGDLLDWFSNYLDNRQQRVIIQGQSSSWGTIKADVPQGSVLGSLMFLIFINDIVDVVRSKIKLFADDTTLYIDVDNPIAAAKTINSDLSSLHQWSRDWLITFNALKTDSMLVTRKSSTTDHPPISFQGHVLQDTNNHKHLGITLRSDLRWSDHISDITNKASKLVGIMKSLKYILDRPILETIYISFVRPILEYASPVWSGCTESDQDKLEYVQLEAARVVTSAMHGTSNAKLYEELGWHKLSKRREVSKLVLMYKLVHNLAPSPLCSLISSRTDTDAPRYETRQKFDLPHFRARTDLFNKSFFPSSVRLWNELPLNLRLSPSLQEFKSNLLQPIKRPVLFPKLFNCGKRFLSILHTRLRLGASQLNSHLFKIGVKDTAKCICGSDNEDSWHYFFVCPLYTAARSKLHSTISNFAPFTLQTVLYGHGSCSLSENTRIFSAVHEYIEMSERFKPSGVG